MIDFDSKELILLTGAGFTKNFGGFLASEMWSHIFNNKLIQKNETLGKLLKGDYDFESIYSEIMNSDKYSKEEKNSMNNSLMSAYKRLDDEIKDWVFDNSGGNRSINIYKVRELMNLFVGSGNIKGLFFTLNQDLFIERQCGHIWPGIKELSQDLINKLNRGETNFITIEKDNIEEKVSDKIKSSSGILYIKLHGSYGWKSSDGSDQMVIGSDKENLINKEPLLKCYFDIFQSVIKKGNKKLLIIGYGFADKHINEIILDGVENHNLQIFIMNNQSIDSFEYKLTHGRYYCLPILKKGLRGYFPYSFSEIFPGNQRETAYFKEIKESLL